MYFLLNLKGLTTAFSSSTPRSSSFFGGEAAPHTGLECVPQRSYSLMRFHNDSVFLEIFLKRCQGKRRGKDSVCWCGRALEMLNVGSGITNVTLEDSLQLSFIFI